MKRLVALCLATAPLLGVGACASIWGFQSVTETSGDATTDDSGAQGETGQGGGDAPCVGCVDAGASCADWACDAGSGADSGGDADAGPCGAGGCDAGCGSGVCPVPGGGCVLPTTSANCGACGNACSPASGAVCAELDAGVYGCMTCPAATPTACAPGVCVDTTSTASNCGGCAGAGGRACPPDLNDAGVPACAHGVCTFSCNSGFTLCGYDDAGAGGTCLRLDTTSNCGACGVHCVNDAGAPTACVAGDAAATYVCAGSCPGGQTACSGACVNTQTDVQNCNGCGRACTTNVANAHPTCVTSNCGFACNGSLSLCSGMCVDETSDPNHCGGCSTTCSGSKPLCVGSTCVSSCTPPTPDLCTGTCTDKQTDPSNCGACAKKCTTSVANATPSCAGGACGFTCNSGYTSCNGACVNEQTDKNNCGGCGSAFACASGLSCQNGACTCVASSCPSCPLLTVPCCKTSTTCSCSGLLGSGCN